MTDERPVCPVCGDLAVCGCAARVAVAESPDFDRIANQLTLSVPEVSGAPWLRASIGKSIAEQLRQVWNARGAADRGRIGEIIGEQREPDYSLRMAQESIKTLDR